MLQVKDPRKAKYLAMIEWLDETCGELMGQLKKKGVADNTLVIYLADNGWNESRQSASLRKRRAHSVHRALAWCRSNRDKDEQ